MFTYGSICSGIEAASVAWQGLGKPLWFAEIEPFPSALLAYRYPEIPNLGDMTALPEKILNREIKAPDVLVGGTPCQAFSVAGKRESLDDERGNLTLALIHILEAIDYVRNQNGQPPCVLVWENVQGVLSTKDNAFGHLLAGLAQECQPLQPSGARWTNSGYVHSARTICWRVLNAQYFGVAQRRKRVFLVASARRRSVAQILLEQKSLRGDFNQSQEEEKSSAKNIGECSYGAYPSIICKDKDHTVGIGIAPTMTASQYKELSIIIHGTQEPIISQTTAHCLGRNNGQENVLFEVKGEEAVRIADKPISPTLKARMGTGGNNVPCICQPSIIRKLTPTECERLQGFPDNWTPIPYRNKPIDDCPDSPRYKAIGNSMAVPVMRWIGERLVDYLKQP
ncbi:DNA cytosine methyltransferase [Histophilus somni]|uniref:DNA (cytosine-5-)-methyltransferase n=1 Tax=Histophilus somni TaxID=731 RepID=A0A9Q6K6T5_HISSO|nr:DNA cytosine methyltransferase [Histophilus somni]ARU64343.1 DNA (cytosine-5-)-methyltransferase [Histophilus somni]ARU66130.1 DNA (cytosine-5-)-methyltransferase [Histophilus somni]ARU68004.1 DNA (cytosine-5-)-methyltransferase [Histophilus somni]ARU69884.1 DNA (cytosine-5-)-methyltransferase [Histophilus somni]ARU71759.1 DNA (cytosine-5-)-methyltransferase [Histophilus somni]